MEIKTITETKEKSFYPILFLSLLVTIWGFTFPLEKIALESISPFSLNLYRFLIADLLMLAIFFPIIKRDFMITLRSGAILGGLTAVAYLFQTWGLAYTTPAKSGFITSMYVVLTPLLSVLIEKTKLNYKTIAALFLASIGIYLTELSGNVFVPNFGDFLTLLCSFAFAFQVVATTVLMKKEEGKEIAITFHQLYMVTIVNLPFYLFSFHSDRWNFQALSLTVFIALFASVMGTIWQMRYQKQVGTVASAFIYVGEPVTASIFSALIVGERFGTFQMIGFAAIVVSAVWIQIKR